MSELEFTDRLWKRVESSVIAPILDHPFMKGLIDGTLSEDKFRAYIIQDHKYLEVYGRVLNLLAAKATKTEHAIQFTQSALNIMTVESNLHHRLLAEWSITEADVAEAPMQPACMMYTSYLQAAVFSKPFHEGVAAVLPCYWIYQFVGAHLKKLGSGNPRYQAWIDTYGGPEFEAIVTKVLQLMNEIAGGLHEEQLQACEEHFFNTSRMEYMFWDGPFRGESWPI